MALDKSRGRSVSDAGVVEVVRSLSTTGQPHRPTSIVDHAWRQGLVHFIVSPMSAYEPERVFRAVPR